MEKGLPSTKAGTKQSSLEALLLYVELDKADPIIEEVLPILANKQPKIVAATLAALTAVIHAFGVKICDPKPVLKALPKVFGHADKNVRAEASNLAVELYRWLREAMKTLFWGELKPVQQQDLEKMFEAVKQEPSPKQERLLRSQQAVVAAASSQGDEEDGAEGEDDEAEELAEIDTFDLAEPVDVYGNIPKDFQESLASTKWKDRKDALDAFFAIANVDRIKDGPFDEVIQIFAKSMKDANVAVVTVAANCIDVLAKGLRKSFAKYRSRLMAPIMERLKEKKQQVADALGQALDSVFASTSLSDCLEDILEFLKHKNPQVKFETLKFLIRCLKNTRQVPSKPETKAIADTAIKLFTESSEATRSGGAEILGTLMKIMGERPMNPYLEGLDDIRKTKIKEYFDTAEVKAKDKPKPVAAPPKAAPPAQKKAMNKKPPAGLKKPTQRASTPQPEEPVSLQPRPTTGRSIPSKLGGLPKPGLAGPSAGMKLQKKMTGPGGAAPPYLPSPKRSVTSPAYEDETGPAPKLGRGLAGRPLGKPAPAPSESSAPAPPPGMTAAERAELEELRSEKDRFQHSNEDLRADKSKLTSQIHELRNQNAQLIEDHTRDVLSIKAKETQLVRARSDAESAEQTVAKQTREIERLKRELNRTVRAGSSTRSPSTNNGGTDHHIYRDSSFSSNGTAAQTSGAERYNSAMSNSREVGYQRARNYMHSPSEEKENGGLEGEVSKEGTLMVSNESDGGRDGETERDAADGNGPSRERGVKDPQWQKAHEVTIKLKARIEQMKVWHFPPFCLYKSFILIQPPFPLRRNKVSPDQLNLTFLISILCHYRLSGQEGGSAHKGSEGKLSMGRWG